MVIDYDGLRDDLMDYFGTAMGYNPAAVVDLSYVEVANNCKLEEIAVKNGFDLSDYTYPVLHL